MQFDYFTYTPYPFYFKEAVEIAANDKLFCVFVNGRKHFYKVVEDAEFTYRIQKTQVRAINGAKGLLEFCRRASHNGAHSDSMVDIFLSKLIANCKEC